MKLIMLFASKQTHSVVMRVLLNLVHYQWLAADFRHQRKFFCSCLYQNNQHYHNHNQLYHYHQYYVAHVVTTTYTLLLQECGGTRGMYDSPIWHLFWIIKNKIRMSYGTLISFLTDIPGCQITSSIFIFYFTACTTWFSLVKKFQEIKKSTKRFQHTVSLHLTLTMKKLVQSYFQNFLHR